VPRNQPPGNQHDVHAAAAETFQVDRDILEADRFQIVDHVAAALRIGESGDLLGGDFNPRQIALVVSHAERLKPALPQEAFGLIDHFEPLGRNRFSVCDTAAQAGRGRFVPRGQLPVGGELANLRLGQPTFGQGTSHVAMACGLQARAMLAVVIPIGAVGHDRHIQSLCQVLDLHEQLGLAMVATIGLIRLVGRD
jgi:hypothetical protein